MDFQLLLFLRILLVVVLYAAVLQVVVVARREMRQEAKVAAQGAAPARAGGRGVGHLVVLDRGSTQLRDGDVYPIEEITTLGRGLTNNILVESPYASDEHARILFNAQDSTLSVEDLESRNGTYIDGRRVNGRMAVSPGATLQVGDARFKFMS